MGLTERKKSGRIFDGSLLNVPGQGILTKKIQSSFTKNLPYRPEVVPPAPTPSVTPTQLLPCDFTGVDITTQTPTPTPSNTPTLVPILLPTILPTTIPTVAPSLLPSISPTRSPTTAPTTGIVLLYYFIYSSLSSRISL